MKVVVERLSKNVEEEHLREMFGEYGTILDMDLPIGRFSESGLVPSAPAALP